MAEKRSYLLLTLGTLLAAGAASRVMPALAEAGDAPLQAEAERGAGTETLRDPSEVCFSGSDAEALREAHASFDARRGALAEESGRLEAKAAELEEMRRGLGELSQRIDVRWAELQGVSNSDLKHLSAMYSAMKPDQAAGIFDQMDPAFAAGFLREIPADQAGLIMARMEPEKAYAVSIRLAARAADLRPG